MFSTGRSALRTRPSLFGIDQPGSRGEAHEFRMEMQDLRGLTSNNPKGCSPPAPPTLCESSFAESKYDACVVPEVVLVVTTSRDEGIAKTGEQVIHLEWAKRYRFAQSNVEPSTNGHSK